MNYLNRDDLSKFLVHLTREYKGINAEVNLINILKKKTIEARNPHCLFKHKINKMGFSKRLQRKFNCVCFTETPLTQIKQLVGEIKGRQIKLKPFGLVFWKDDLLKRGASPAIYINAKGTDLKNYIMDKFTMEFDNVTKYNELEEINEEHCYNIVQYYSLINVIQDNYNFLWEREWRHHGDFSFGFEDIVTIIVERPDDFLKRCRKEFKKNEYNLLKRCPIIKVNWTYEEVIEEMAFKIWEK